MLLNGSPIRLRGVSRQDSTLSPAAPSRDGRSQARYRVAAICELQQHLHLRLLPDEEFLTLCDEAGIYLMDEPGTCGFPDAAASMDPTIPGPCNTCSSLFWR